MFEPLGLLGSKPVELELATRARTHVANSQGPNPGQQSINQFRLMLKQHPEWEVRKEPCGIYNCFGHVWAARRTGIYDDTEVHTILKDDGYRTLQEGEKPIWGDVALYSDPSGADLFHVGLVCELRVVSLGAGNNIIVPWVLSKWHIVSGEVLHHANDVSFLFPGDGFKLEYRTDRPEELHESP